MRSLQSIEKFAYSVYEIAKEEKLIQKYKEDIELLLVGFEQASGFFDSLSDVTVDFKQRQNIFKNTFGQDVDKYLISLVSLLIERDLFKSLKPILKKALRLINNEIGVKTVVIRTAFELKEEQYNRLIKALEQKYATIIEATVVVDPTLIGGISVDFHSEVLDNTIKTKLSSIISKNYLYGGE